MPSERFEQLLDRAAAVLGIDPDYWDIWGNHHVTGKEAKQAILGALGVPANTAEELEAALSTLARREWERLVPPVTVVADDSAEVELQLNVPSGFERHFARFSIRWEHGQ